MSRVPNDILFQPDELELRVVDPDWGEADILKQKGIFFLKDLMVPLNIFRPRLMSHVTKVEAEGKKPWDELGLRKTWAHWQVRMTVFAHFYQEQLRVPYLDIPESWDGNTLVNQHEGVFLLTEVCRLLPFTVHQIRYQSIKNPSEMGVAKNRILGKYLVDIAIFGPWVKKNGGCFMSNHSPTPRQMILNALKEGGIRLHDMVLQDFERVFNVAFRYYQETRQLPYHQPIKIRVVLSEAKKVG